MEAGIEALDPQVSSGLISLLHNQHLPSVRLPKEFTLHGGILSKV